MPAAALPESLALCLTAASIGAAHTLLGPDHYVPFVAMSRAGGWSTAKTLRVTAGCGLAHVAGSVLIGVAGLAVGLAAVGLEEVEAFRGDVAAWLLVVFGLAYLGWGLARALRPIDGPHGHVHANAAALEPAAGGPVRVAATASPALSPWILFLIFAFGPCEPLIPLLLYPAARASPLAVAGVATSFAVATLVTMCVAVILLARGVGCLPARGLERFAHALAGAAIVACGVAVLLGL